MEQLIERFEEDGQHQVKASYGASGKLFAQIHHGAPFDMFFSADQIKPKKLLEQGLAKKGTLLTYAIGSLAVWGSMFESAEQIKQALISGQFLRVSLANPKLAPYGSAAVAVMMQLGIAERDRGKWVMGENIAHALQFAASDNAEIGFVALPQAKAQKYGAYWIVDADLYPPIKQDAVLLMKGENNPGALAFLKFIKSTEATKIIARAGYQIVGQ